MTALRGPGPEPRYWAKDATAMTPRAQAMFVDRTQPPVEEATQFSGQEINALLSVHPTPYMDEADLPDPSWAIPSYNEIADLPVPIQVWWYGFFGEGGNK